MSTILNNEALDAVLTECLLTDEEASGATDLQEVVPAHGILTSYVFHPQRLEAHADQIHAMLGELGAPYEIRDEAHPDAGGGWSFLNMCMTKDGEQWTGLHRQQEKLYCLGIGSGWAIELMPKNMWSLLPGGMPYLGVLHERKKVETIPLAEVLEVVEGRKQTPETPAEEREDTVEVDTGVCRLCGRGGQITMPRDAYDRWKAGAYIDVAWPEGSAGEREQLITGTHGPCFDKAFPAEEE